MSRKLGAISLEERQQILMEYELHGHERVKEEHDISNRTLQHIRFYHGKSRAKQQGYYHKDLLANVKTLKERISELKETGLTSGEIAEELDISLAQVNKNWV